MTDIARRRTGRAAGFTLAELLLVSVLMMGVSVVTAQTWRYLAVDIIDLRTRARLSQELRIAVESVSQDMGSVVGATPVDGNSILLCQDSGTTPDGQADWGSPDIVVQYYVADRKLIRKDQSTATEIVIAGDVSSFTVENLTGTVVRMIIEVQRGDVTRKATFIWSRP